MRLAPVGEIIVHEEEGDAFLLQVNTGKYYGLNRSGLEVWKALVSGLSPIDELAQKYPNRSRDVLQADADALIATLLKAGLLSEES